LQLLPHRPAEVELDENPDGQRILDPPRLRFDTQKPDFGGNPLSEVGECCVHARRICLQLPSLARSQHCSLATGGRGNSQHPHLPVAVERRLSKNFGQTAGRQPSRHFHLKEPIAGVKISLGKPQGCLTAGIHVRDTPPIKKNLDPSRTARQVVDKRTALGKTARRRARPELGQPENADQQHSHNKSEHQEPDPTDHQCQKPPRGYSNLSPPLWNFEFRISNFWRGDSQVARACFPRPCLCSGEEIPREDARHADMRLRTTSCRDARHLR